MKSIETLNRERGIEMLKDKPKKIKIYTFKVVNPETRQVMWVYETTVNMNMRLDKEVKEVENWPEF